MLKSTVKGNKGQGQRVQVEGKGKQQLPAMGDFLLEHWKDNLLVGESALVVATLQHGIQVSAPCEDESSVARAVAREHPWDWRWAQLWDTASSVHWNWNLGAEGRAVGCHWVAA